MAALTALIGLQERRRVAQLLDGHVDTSSTALRKATALVNASPSTAPLAERSRLLKASWRVRALLQNVRNVPQAEDDGTQDGADPDSAEAGSDDGLELEDGEVVVMARLDLDAVEDLADCLDRNATAADLDTLWAAVEVAAEQFKSGSIAVWPGLDGKRNVDPVAALHEEMARLHGVMQEAGRLVQHVAELELRDVRRVHLLRTRTDRVCKLATSAMTASSHIRLGDSDSDDNSGEVGGGGGSRCQGGTSAARSNGSAAEGDARARLSPRQPQLRDSAAGGGEQQQQQEASTQDPSGGSSGSGREGGGRGDSESSSGAASALRGAAGSAAAGEAASGITQTAADTGEAESEDAASAKVNAKAEAKRLKREQRAVADATTGWILGSVMLMLYQGLDFPGIVYGTSGHRLLTDLQYVTNGLRLGMRRLAHDEFGPPGGSGDDWRLQSVRWRVGVAEAQLQLLHKLAHVQVRLQLSVLLDDYCRDGWRTLPATAKAAAAVTGATAVAPAAPAPPPGTPATPPEQLLELYARCVLETDLIMSKGVTSSRSIWGSAAQKDKPIAELKVLAAAQDAKAHKRLRRKLARLGRTPLLNELVRAALAAELEAGRGQVAAARDAYRQAAAAAVAGAAAGQPAAHSAAGNAVQSAEADEQQQQQLAQAQQTLLNLEASQHMHGVLLKLCDWQEGVRQNSCDEERQRRLQRAAAPKAAHPTTTAAGLVEQGGGGGGGAGGGTDDEQGWTGCKRGTRPGGARGEQANGVGRHWSSDDDDGGSDDDESSDGDDLSLELALHLNPLQLRVQPGSFTFTATTEAAGGGAPPGGGCALLSSDGSVSTFTRAAVLSSNHLQGHRWWADVWKTLLSSWPTGVVPCTWGSTALYGTDASDGGYGGGGGGVPPAQRQRDAMALMRPNLQYLMYGVEEGMPFVALGSYTLALLLRHLVQLQARNTGAHVLQPTAIRAPGRHTQEDPHTLPGGAEPCVVVSQLGYEPCLRVKPRPHHVRDYLHAASPATAGSSAAESGSSSTAAAKSGGGKGGGGGGRHGQQQQQQQQPTKQLADLISELLEEDDYAQLVCKSCEDVAGAVLAISQVRQARQAEAAEVEAVKQGLAPPGPAASGAVATRLERLRKPVGFVVVISPESVVTPMSSIIKRDLLIDDPNFDPVLAGDMALLVTLLTEVDAGGRRVKSACMAQAQLHQELGAGRGGGGRGAGAGAAAGRGQGARVVRRR
ncbi:hypothetical protein HXX76_006444 [Chlamydomonas incerta]|uniref:Uncharacterized protein n=1 Tax=Chlamydomonas incerta TaxID=51695 RepID=A0A835TFN3_CHLIN|nr:hypothetical protein HXX76_006444 [Chlamydomonas incerta]|eukprot:KAG2436925.1 hypothetical protein HXX76_006444 [Chlamydomonas incerta]